LPVWLFLRLPDGQTGKSQKRGDGREMGAMADNRKAFLDMIAFSEGTSKIPNSDNGYKVIVGSTISHPNLMTSYADHPRRLIHLNGTLASTAAGRYQLLSRYFDVYKKQLNLPDFSPASQDAIALQQIKECKALADIDAGNIQLAIIKCAHIWASLPGAGYGQHENKMAALVTAYTTAGGILAA
jgi:muramidase (phage lysozyme)